MGKKKSGGLTYYQDFKSNMKNLKGYETHGYIYEAPHQKVSGISSGTEIRNLLGNIFKFYLQLRDVEQYSLDLSCCNSIR